MIRVDKIIYELQIGDFVHRYSLQAISWSVTREMAPLYAPNDSFARGKRGIAGAIIGNISITWDQPYKGKVTLFKDGTEVLILDNVEVLNEGVSSRSLVADVQMTFVATDINGSLLGKSELRGSYTV
jgi:hypothetical protein